jgi:hypothetical protein
MAHLVVTDRRAALTFGVAAIVAGTWLLTQAYEARGRQRPLWAQLLPNVG